jgi:anti-sigma factor ChrR (cupin superfamily)
MDKSQRRIIATREATLEPYYRDGRRIPGAAWLPLSREAGEGRGCYLVRFEPGGRSFPHEHTDVEEFLVLEGSLTDSDGTRFNVGDFVSFAAGTQHYSVAPEGCLLLVVLRAPNRYLEMKQE